jgi:hypothetical protein
MPVAEVLEKFIEYADRPLNALILEHNRDVIKFQRNLRKRNFKVRGELSRDIHNQDINISNYTITFNNLIGKISRLLEDRFYQSHEKFNYIDGRFDIIVDRLGPVPHQFAYQIFEYCNDLLDFFNQQKTEYEKLITNINSKDQIQPKGRIQKKRTASRQSFQLINTDANLNMVHRILREAKIIDQATSYENFEKVFNGEPVSPKVIWENANALHYFIQEIIKGKGVKSPNEGKWARAIKCFKKHDGEFKISELKNTKPPASARTNMLDLAIEEINGH